MKTKKRLLLTSGLLLTLAIAAGVLLLLSREEQVEPVAADQRPEAAPSLPVTVVQEPAVPQPTQSEPAAEPVAPAEISEQVRQTRRMVAAHAPLRQPSVADPDSLENKKILQAMITKALANGPTATPPLQTADTAETTEPVTSTD